jgi:hypothetical protein
MRVTSQFALLVLLGGLLSVLALGAASALPAAPSGVGLKSAGAESAVVEPARTYRKRKVHCYYRRPGRTYYVPYFCSQPYQYRYWMYYAPICYPL